MPHSDVHVRVELGQPAPAFTVTLEDGKQVGLSDFAGRSLVLIFLRHLAWLPCQDHLVQVAEVVQPALERRAASVLVISFGTPAAVASYRARTGLPFVFAADPGREAYQAYGMLRASRWRVWHPRVLWGYLVLTLRGMRPRRAASGEDLSQLGGDFVIGPDGRLRLAHVSQGPEDRPSALRLLSAL